MDFNNTDCSPEELSLKSFFVGPQAENADILYGEIKLILDNWVDWRRNYYAADGVAISPMDQNHPEFQKKITHMRDETMKLLEGFSKEIPKFSPRYLGHMFSEVSMPAILGHLVALLHNPNNVSRESSWVGVEIERKAIQRLSEMVGYSQQSVGHFTSGGTLANFEAIYRAKNLRTNKILSSSNDLSFNDACYLTNAKTFNQRSEIGEIELYKIAKEKYNIDFNGLSIIVPDSKHYSWTKAATLFGIGSKNLITVSLNKYGQIDSKDLKNKIDHCLKNNIPISCVVSVFGTTELGTIDPIDEVNEVLASYKKEYGYNFWHHVDAAYGGFFACLKDANFFAPDKQRAVEAIGSTTSITIDPHKLGYVPYAAGAFICNDPSNYYVTEVSAPYVDFELNKDLGPYTLEGSRSATGAAALYMTSECIGLNKDGYGKILERTIKTAEIFKQTALNKKLPFLFVETVGTNIVCFAIGKKGDALSEVNKKTKDLLEKIIRSDSSPNENIYFVSKTSVVKNYEKLIQEYCNSHGLIKDTDTLELLRLTIMNPFANSKHSKTNYIEGCLNYLSTFRNSK